jgi:hypothetical protein
MTMGLHIIGPWDHSYGALRDTVDMREHMTRWRYLMD